MRPVDASVLNADEPLGAAFKRIQDSTADAFLVRLRPSGWATVGRQDIELRLGEGKAEMTLHAVVPTKPVPYLHPDQPLEMALRYVYQSPLVPVISRADPGKLEGIVTQRDVLARYEIFDREAPAQTLKAAPEFQPK
jgi:CBS domain-containing protein